MGYNEHAFHQICTDAKAPEAWYVCLLEQIQFYGGPEEGGWYGTDTEVIAYQEFPTKEAAETAREAVKALANELSRDSKRQYGEQCLRELDFAEARGVEAESIFPEPDTSDFIVRVYDHIPTPSHSDRHYS